MNKKQRSVLTKIFTISGTLMLWAPILFMFVTAIVGSIMRKALLFDYLMLAEMFPIVALGLVLLVLASLLSGTFRKWFGWGSVAALVTLSCGQIFASVSGLASGALAENGAAFAVVIASIVIYNIIVVALAILGILLIRRLFRKEPDAAPAAE
jgi:hypothetical protein